jgi:hypothetical protein
MLRFVVTALSLVMPLAAQVANFDFSKLAEKAKEKTEINLDRAALAALKVKMGDKSPISNVESVVVRNYEFEKKGEYPAEALEPLRKQITADKSWSKVVSTQERDERTDIFFHNEGGKMAGLLVISVEADEVSVIEIRGAVEMAQLSEVVNSAIQYDMAELRDRK